MSLDWHAIAQRTESLKFQTEFVLNVVLNSARVLKISETILNIA